MRPAVRNVALNLAGQLAPMTVAVVAMPVLVHAAGAERLGFLGLAWALIGYFALLDLGLSRVVTRRVAVADGSGELAVEWQVTKRLCLRLFIGVALVSSLLAATVPAALVVGHQANPVVVDEARTALIVLWATLPLTVVTGLLRGALEGLQQFGRVNLLRAFFGAWTFAAPLLVLRWSHALGPLTLSIAIGRVLSLGAHTFLARAAVRRRDAAYRAVPAAQRPTDAPETPSLRSLLREGGWLTVSNVVSPMMVTFDRFAIATIVSLAAASYYFVPQETSLRLLVVPSAIASTIFPLLARIDRGTVDGHRIAQHALRAVTATCLPLCAIVGGFAEPLLTLWMGPAFAAASAGVAAAIAVGLFANCCAQVPFAWIQAAGRSDVTGKLHLIQLPVYAALMIFLTIEFGIVGTAVAWSLRAVADATLLSIAASRLFSDVALGSTLPPIAAGLVLLIALGLTPLLPSAVASHTVASVLLLACVAISLVLGDRIRRDLRR